jgi:hypothetical protein
MKRIWTARLALAACAFVLTAAGCTRHGLMARTDDGGSSPAQADAREAALPDLATEPPVEAAGEDTPPDVGPESGPEISPDVPDDAGPEARAELAPDLRDAGLESRSEIGTEVAPEVGGDTRPEVAPEVARDLPSETSADGGPSACPVWTSTTTLAELEWLPLPSAFVVQGDNLFVGISQPGTEVVPPSNAIVAISISTGKTTTFSLGASLPGWLAAGGDALFYIHGKATPAGGGAWSFDYPDLARLDLTTGHASVVDSELFPLGYAFLSVVGNSSGEVFWSMLAGPNDPTAVIRRWNQATRSVETVMTVAQPAALMVDQNRLYWAGLASSGQMACFSAATAGGAVSVIHEWSSGLENAPSLLALDAQSLYFSVPSRRPAGIFSIPKAGGESRTVVATADPAVLGSQTIDDTHVYWIDWSDTRNIPRAPKTGDGSVETIATGGTDEIWDLVVDGCNVYWMASGKSRVLVRSK